MACVNINLLFQKLSWQCLTKTSWFRMQEITALLIFWKVLVVLAAHCREATVASCYSPSTARCVLMGNMSVLVHHVWVPEKFHWTRLLSPLYLPATPYLDLQFLKPRYNKKSLYSFNHLYFYLYLQVTVASSIPKQATSQTVESSRKSSHYPKKLKVDMAFIINNQHLFIFIGWKDFFRIWHYANWQFTWGSYCIRYSS